MLRTLQDVSSAVTTSSQRTRRLQLSDPSWAGSKHVSKTESTKTEVERVASKTNRSKGCLHDISKVLWVIHFHPEGSHRFNTSVVVYESNNCVITMLRSEVVITLVWPSLMHILNKSLQTLADLINAMLASCVIGCSLVQYNVATSSNATSSLNSSLSHVQDLPLRALMRTCTLSCS